ncbi:MAG: hypothetical protein KA984_01950 [Candidatus Cloacimonetes bacterium]|nr:hypothetical protein [Candidatus Cloacimonadota bacterium]
MTNTIRNTIVLGILFILLSVAAFSTYRSLNKKANLLTEENKKTAQKIAVLESQISNIDSLKYEYELRKAMLAEQSKVILAHDTPTTTYQYLLRLQNWMDRNVFFDFAVRDKVAFGYLYSIDVAKGKATFIIDKYGSPEEHSMYITTPN